MGTTSKEHDAAEVTNSSDPLIVFSGDAHVGPLLDDLRQYCPKDYLDDFDGFAADLMSGKLASGAPSFFGELDATETQRFMQAIMRNAGPGHHDMDAYLRDMDTDGIAAEMFFHGSQNGQPVPFVGPVGFSFDHADKASAERRAVGIHIYNQWLADAAAHAPERLFPAVLLPGWDIEASRKELEWCVDHGLRIACFPAPRPGVPNYEDPAWEPFWTLAEERNVLLATHAGSGDLQEFMTIGPQAFTLMEIEAGGWMARRGIGRLIFAGVFEKHPDLHVCVTEQNGEWLDATIREYDSSYAVHGWMYRDQVPEPPSHYLKQNVFIGASFMAPFEAKAAVEGDYWDNVIWGRDYPHIEGTWVAQDEADALSERNLTHQSLRYGFADIPGDKTAAMLGGNAIRLLGLDRDALQAVANRIHAPTLDELSTPIAAIPDDGGTLAFRTVGPWS